MTTEIKEGSVYLDEIGNTFEALKIFQVNNREEDNIEAIFLITFTLDMGKSFSRSVMEVKLKKVRNKFYIDYTYLAKRGLNFILDKTLEEISYSAETELQHAA